MIDIVALFFLKLRAKKVSSSRSLGFRMNTFSKQGGDFFSYFSFASIQARADRRIEAIAHIEKGNPTGR